MEKVKKDLEMRPLETTMTETLVLINSGIDIDATLLRQIGKRAAPKEQESELKAAGGKLGYKIGQVSDVMGWLVDKMKQLEKRMDGSESEIKTLVSERVGSVQSQLDEYKKSNNRENRALKESMQVSVNGFEEKVREMEAKTLWQITDCQNKLENRVN